MEIKQASSSAQQAINEYYRPSLRVATDALCKKLPISFKFPLFMNKFQSRNFSFTATRNERRR